MTARADPPGLDYQWLFESIPVPMLILDTDLIMVAMNDAYLAVAGATREELLGRTPMAAFPDNPDDPDATGVRNLTRSLAAVLATGRPDTMALQRYDVQTGPGGAFEERYWSPVNMPLLDREGRVRCILHRVVEVTDYVRLRGTQDQVAAERQADMDLRTRIGQLEADLIARAGEVQEVNQRLREANAELSAATRALREEHRDKDRFIATLSHELRNPLTAIKAAVELAVRDLPPGHPSPGVFDRQVAALVRLVDDLLDSSRALTGRLTLTTEPLDLREIVRAVASDLGPDFGRSGRALTVTVPDRPVPVTGDRIRLAQLLGNLLSNGLSYTEPGGTVAVSLTSEDGQAMLAVRDDGIGFDPALAERLFGVFTRAVPPAAEQAAARGPAAPGGLGLGLGLVRGIAEQHGGSVAAHSDGPGTGAEFRVCLPLSTEDAA